MDGPESWSGGRRPLLITSRLMGATELSELERELLGLCSMAGEPTTVLDEEMVASSPGRGELELVLQGLVGRGLMTKARAINAGDPRRLTGSGSMKRLVGCHLGRSSRDRLGAPQGVPQPTGLATKSSGCTGPVGQDLVSPSLRETPAAPARRPLVDGHLRRGLPIRGLHGASRRRGKAVLRRLLRSIVGWAAGCRFTPEAATLTSAASWPLRCLQPSGVQLALEHRSDRAARDAQLARFWRITGREPRHGRVLLP